MPIMVHDHALGLPCSKVKVKKYRVTHMRLGRPGACDCGPAFSASSHNHANHKALPVTRAPHYKNYTGNTFSSTSSSPMPTFKFPGLPSIFTSTLPTPSACSHAASIDDATIPAAGTAGSRNGHARLSMPGAFTDTMEEPLSSPSPSAESTDDASTTNSDSGGDDGVDKITVRELIEDVAGETIREHNSALERNIVGYLDARVNAVFANTDTSMKEFMHVMKGVFDGGLSLAEGKLRDVTKSECISISTRD